MTRAAEPRALETRAATFDAPPGETAERLVTVLVPVIGDPDDLGDLYREYSAPFRASGTQFEFIFIAAPSCSMRIPQLEPLVEAGEPVRGLVAQTISEATLLRVGVSAARGDRIITLPAFHRIEAPGLLHLLDRLDEGADFVVARRWPRRDAWVNRAQAWVFHWITKTLRGDQLNDVSSGVHATRRDVINDLPLYGDLFRFLPILALGAGFNVAEVDTPQHPADRRARLYRPGVYVRRLLDVMGLFFLVRFTEKPLRFFGLVGSAGLVAGSAVLLLLLVERMFGKGVGDRPLMIIGVLLIVLGVQAVGLGLVGEIIVHLHIRRTRRYRALGSAEIDRRIAPVGTSTISQNGTRQAP
jgi:hypothetical protein